MLPFLPICRFTILFAVVASFLSSTSNSQCPVTTKHRRTFSEHFAHIQKSIVSNDADSIRLMSQEFLTPNTIGKGCDLYFGPISEYQMDLADSAIYLERYLPYFVDCLEPGAVIFVSLDWIELFFREMYYRINVPFVFVTGGYSDKHAPGNIKIGNSFSDKTTSKIIHWYSTNCYLSPDPERFSCVPLGISDVNVYGATAAAVMETYAANTVFAKTASFYKSPIVNASYDIVVSFNVNSVPRLRYGIWQMFCGSSLEEASSVITEPFLYTNHNNVKAICFNRMDLSDMYQMVTESTFVLSPHGAGLDCFRTWETLLLGGYPVVVKSTLDELYRDLPVLILDEWSDLTPVLLRETAELFR